MKVFLDANILFSASNSTSHVARFVRFLSEHKIAVTSSNATAEAERNVLVKRPAWHDGYQAIMGGVVILDSVDAPVPVEIAAKDRPIIATAIKHKCDYLVTGDKRDFGHLFGQNISGTKIVTIPMMREALAALQG